MHAPLTIQNWMHHAHEGSTKVAHFTSHLFHEKNFWAIVAIVALIAGLFALIAYFGSDVAMNHYRVPLPFSPYY
ncbi:MAG: hypothetical protein K9M54_01075 [Kiritimatiellales bacterium]|nr:hypothetical protein [Kiritimatiellales bacterium]